MSSSPPSSTVISSTVIWKDVEDDQTSTLRQPSLDLDGDGSGEEHQGDYSTRMEELLDDSEDERAEVYEDEHDEGFIYEGVDADQVSGGYRDRLRDILGTEVDDNEDDEVEASLPQHYEKFGFHAVSLPMTPPRLDSPGPNGTPSKLSKPYLHPTISRLRSAIPQASHLQSTSSVGTSRSHTFESVSPAPSRFSSMSRTSSTSNLHGAVDDQAERDVFRWTQLDRIGKRIYKETPPKASSLLGSPSLGSPMVLAANGLICLGMSNGTILVYDFKQNLKCVCGKDGSANTVGPVSALALSHDHTYVASGHSSGYIQLFDLNYPQTPARTVAPTSLVVVSSGRQEGHLHGSRIVSIGFVAGRHTAVVSADDHGLAFYHSLGKVLFVEASDILRILGQYPQDNLNSISHSNSASSQATANGLAPTATPARRHTRSSILGMMPLPLGTIPHPTDAYNIVALLTPTKLVVVGLKPTPKTWFKRLRDFDDERVSNSKTRRKGTLAWFPSVSPGAGGKTETIRKEANGKNTPVPTTPILAYSWGRTLHLIRVVETKTTQSTQNPRNGKTTEVEVGSIIFEEAGKWTAGDDILVMQWLNPNQLIMFTPTTLDVYGVLNAKLVERIQFESLSLVSPSLSYTTSGALSYADSVGEIAHSVRVYKGKIFLLGRQALQVGTLLTWADRILSFVQDGDFLSAIDLARSYYVGDAPGNRNGLPDDPQLCKDVIGEKMRSLMTASALYTFSEDRMTDGTHVTPDGRGVDRTSLFEALVATCSRACVALDDFSFLFEDLFQQYDDAGITPIFLLQLEPFVLDGAIRYVPPRITQRLVALHEKDSHLDLAERIIWHIDPACLDINQAIHLCQAHQLYDALIYIYTRAIKDYVSPIVELLGLIRKVQQYRKSRMESVAAMGFALDDPVMEPIVMNAYKIYPYLANVLSGLTYPSEEPLGEEESFQAKKDIYTFLFFGRSSMWPLGEGGKLVLTSDEEGGPEPTFPYSRLLLRFDAESFLHSLDIAFEDAYLNDESQGVSRRVIVKTLLEILSSGNLPPADVTLVNIFIARNVPKYPQFIQVATSALHSILISLAEDPDQSTREDRQLAAEYLLSVYNPHESDRILLLFEKANFFRILRSWHRQERRWAPLLSMYLHDPDLRSSEIFNSVDDVLATSTRANKGSLPPELVATISDALSQLLQTSVTSTVVLIDKHAPELHEKALDVMGPDANHKRFTYLRQLLGPQRSEDDEYTTPSLSPGPSSKVANILRQLYISLQCQYHPTDVITILKHLPSDLLDWPQVLQTCEEHGVYDAVVWATNWCGDPRDALHKTEMFEKRLTLRIVDILSAPETLISQGVANIRKELDALEGVSRTAIAICLERSQGPSVTEVPLEDIWFRLLSSQINCVQSVSRCCSAEALSVTTNPVFDEETVEVEWRTLSALRSLVQETFGSLVSISSSRIVSFPQLFKRLVNPVTHAHTSSGTPYKEFRTILTGMLESYRSDGDMLIITKHLVDRDLFEVLEELSRDRARGWAPSNGTCTFCREALAQKAEPIAFVAADGVDKNKIVVSRTGAMYHSRCLPPGV